MKAQHTNQTLIESIAKDNIHFVLDLIADGMTREDAIEAQVDGMLNDPYDETEFDAPFDKAQLIKAFNDEMDRRF